MRSDFKLATHGKLPLLPPVGGRASDVILAMQKLFNSPTGCAHRLDLADPRRGPGPSAAVSVGREPFEVPAVIHAARKGGICAAGSAT